MRRIEQDNFRRRLDGNDIVLLTSVGYSTSGEVFSVPSESLAAECAAKLKASKIIYITSGEIMIDSRNTNTINSLAQVQSLRLNQACALLDKWGMHPKHYNYMENENENIDDTDSNSNKFYDAFSYKEKVDSTPPLASSSTSSYKIIPAIEPTTNITLDSLNIAIIAPAKTSNSSNNNHGTNDHDNADKESVASFVRLLAR